MVDLRDWIVEEVAEGVTRLGTGLVGFHLLEEGGRFTLVDGAFPKYLPHLESYLAGRGSDLHAISAQVLTHHHADHRGMTEHIRTETHGAVWVHEEDRPYISRQQKPPMPPLWKPHVFRAFAHMLKSGIAKTPPVLEADTFADGDIVDVPGRPRVIHVPGHTVGNSALVVGDKAVITGDAMVNLNIFTWEPGPRIPADFFNEDSDLALGSLARLRGLRPQVLLPSHGLPWTGSIDDAVDAALAIGVY